jgi:hypothetical protein
MKNRYNFPVETIGALALNNGDHPTDIPIFFRGFSQSFKNAKNVACNMSLLLHYTSLSNHH